MKHAYETLSEAWQYIVADLYTRGGRQKSRIGDSYEILNYRFELTNPLRNIVHHPDRKFSLTYAAAELIWYFSGNSCGEMICRYAPSYKRFLDEHGNAHGGYGPRIMRYLKTVIEMLKEKPDSRQAVISIFRPEDVYFAQEGSCKDIPCTIALQFLVRNDKVHLITTMRSNDAWLGLPYDVFCFTSIQWVVAQALGLEVGTYCHNVGSMHLYTKDASKFSRNYEREPKQDWELSRSKDSMWDMDKAVRAERRIYMGVMNDFDEEFKEGNTLGRLCTSAVSRVYAKAYDHHLPEQLRKFK